MNDRPIPWSGLLLLGALSACGESQPSETEALLERAVLDSSGAVRPQGQCGVSGDHVLCFPHSLWFEVETGVTAVELALGPDDLATAFVLQPERQQLVGLPLGGQARQPWVQGTTGAGRSLAVSPAVDGARPRLYLASGGPDQTLGTLTRWNDAHDTSQPLEVPLTTGREPLALAVWQFGEEGELLLVGDNETGFAGVVQSQASMLGVTASVPTGRQLVAAQGRTIAGELTELLTLGLPSDGGEGRLDLWHLENGMPLLQLSRATGADPNDLALADLDEDGICEALTVSDISNGTLQVFYGAELENAWTVSVGAFPHAVEAADLNGDGHQDAIVLLGADSGLLVFMGNGTGSFADPVPLPHGLTQATGLKVGDIDGDTRPDLVVASYDGLVRVMLSAW